MLYDISNIKHDVNLILSGKPQQVDPKLIEALSHDYIGDSSLYEVFIEELMSSYIAKFSSFPANNAVMRFYNDNKAPYEELAARDVTSLQQRIKTTSFEDIRNNLIEELAYIENNMAQHALSIYLRKYAENHSRTLIKGLAHFNAQVMKACTNSIMSQTDSTINVQLAMAYQCRPHVKIIKESFIKAWASLDTEQDPALKKLCGLFDKDQGEEKEYKNALKMPYINDMESFVRPKLDGNLTSLILRLLPTVKEIALFRDDSFSLHSETMVEVVKIDALQRECPQFTELLKHITSDKYKESKAFALDILKSTILHWSSDSQALPETNRIYLTKILDVSTKAHGKFEFKAKIYTVSLVNNIVVATPPSIRKMEVSSDWLDKLCPGAAARVGIGSVMTLPTKDLVAYVFTDITNEPSNVQDNLSGIDFQF